MSLAPKCVTGFGSAQVARSGRGLVVTDQLPDGVSFVSSEPAAEVTGRTLRWSSTQAPGLGNLTPGNEETLTVTVQIDARFQAGTRIANQVQVAGETHNGDILSNDPDTLEVDDPTAFLVGGNPDISVVKTVEESVADNVWRIGETVRYRGGSKPGDRRRARPRDPRHHRSQPRAGPTRR